MIASNVTLEMVKDELKKEKRPVNKLELLMSEKVRLERTIQTLEKNLNEIVTKIEEYKKP